MPSIALSDSWFCRMDIAKDDCLAKLRIVLGWVDCLLLLATHHLGDTKENPHIHFVVKLGSKIQKQSFDIRFKKVFNPDKKSSWSTKPWDGQDAACSYLFHESTADVIINKGFSDEEIDKFKKLNESVQKVVAINKAKGANRIVDRVLHEIEKDDKSYNREDIFTRLITLIRDGEMYEPGDYRLKAITEEIYLKSLPSHRVGAYAIQRFRNVFKDEY